MKYKITAQTNVYERNPNATGDADSIKKVSSLSVGTVIDSVQESTHVTSWSKTPILYLDDNRFVYKKDTKIYSENSLSNSFNKEEMDMTYTITGSIIFLIAGLFIAYKVGGKWWMYLIFSAVGSNVGAGLGYLIDKKLSKKAV